MLRFFFLARNGVRIRQARQHTVHAVACSGQHGAQLPVFGLGTLEPLGKHALLRVGTHCQRLVFGFGTIGQCTPFRLGTLGEGEVFGSGGRGKLNQLLYPRGEIIKVFKHGVIVNQIRADSGKFDTV